VLEIPRDDIRDRTNYPMQETWLHKGAVSFLSFLFRFMMILEVEGLENLPRQGPAVLTPNHLTNFDAFPLQIAIPRCLFYMGKAELFKNPILHALFRQLAGYPVYRGARDEWAILHSKRLIIAGQVICIFPEGTRSKGRGLKVAKTGAARLAIEANCPVVPVAVDGSQQFFKRFPRRTRVRVRVCKPIWPAKDELPLAMTERIMFTLAEHLPNNLRGVYRDFTAKKF